MLLNRAATYRELHEDRETCKAITKKAGASQDTSLLNVGLGEHDVPCGLLIIPVAPGQPNLQPRVMLRPVTRRYQNRHREDPSEAYGHVFDNALLLAAWRIQEYILVAPCHQLALFFFSSRVMPPKPPLP